MHTQLTHNSSLIVVTETHNQKEHGVLFPFQYAVFLLNIVANCLNNDNLLLCLYYAKGTSETNVAVKQIVAFTSNFYGYRQFFSSTEMLPSFKMSCRWVSPSCRPHHSARLDSSIVLMRSGPINPGLGPSREFGSADRSGRSEYFCWPDPAQYFWHSWLKTPIFLLTFSCYLPIHYVFQVRFSGLTNQ